MQTQNGFLIDVHSVIYGLEVPISDCPVTKMPRIAYHKGLRFTQEMELVQEIGIRFLSKDGTKPLRDLIVENVVDPRRRNAELDKWQDSMAIATTEGALVDAQTGQPAEADTVGAIPQLLFMQQLTPPMLKAAGMPIDKSTPVLHIVYLIIVQEILKLDKAGRL